MTFRRRVTIVSTTAVALAMALASVVLFLLVRHQMYSEIDSSLTSRAQFAHAAFDNRGGTFNLPRAAPGGAEGFTQFVDSTGTIVPGPDRPSLFGNGGVRYQLPGNQHTYVDAAGFGFGLGFGASRPVSTRPASGSTSGAGAPGAPGTVNGRTGGDGPAMSQRLPISAHTIAVAKGTAETYLADVTYNHVHFRVLTFRLATGTAVEVARPLDEVDSVSHDLVRILVLVFIGSIGLSLLLGSFVMRALLAPVRRLTRATEHVAASQDLSRRIETTGDSRDELGRLAHSFNEMMEALEGATNAQRQLIDDASHELRTPLTSLRTNMDVLLRGRHLTDEMRGQLVEDVSEQLDELSQLVGDLVDLASGNEETREPRGVLDLDDVVHECVSRARRIGSGLSFDLEAHTGTRVMADRDQLYRAIGNLLTNAIKWNPEGAPVEVAVNPGGEVTVRDHGPGVPDPDKAKIFERFYRTDDARDTPGSGLGLAIARKVVDEHDGRIWVTDAPGGGAMFHLLLPICDADITDDADEAITAMIG